MTTPSPDLVVVGAGTMGAWTALRARRAGWSTTLIDAFGAGHPRSTSGDETRICRASHGADAFYVRWAREARQAWIDFGEETGEAFYLQCGMAWFAHREDAFEAHSIATLTSMGIPIERVPADEIGQRWPGVRGDDLAFAAFEPEAGLLFARRGVAAVARAFGAAGGRFELAGVRPGATDGRRLLDVIGSDGARFGGGTFVFAAGPWLPALFPDLLGGRISVTKQDVMFLGPAPGDGRFNAEWLPCWVDSDAGAYGIPAVDGRGLKIAPDRPGPPFDPTDGERLVDPESVRLARAYAALRLPDLALAPVIETRVCQYEETADTHFILDRHPDFDNVWIAGGGSGHGFKHGPVIGSYLVSRLAGAPASAEEGRFSLAHERVRTSNMRLGGSPPFSA